MLDRDPDLVQLRQCMHCLQNCKWYKGKMTKKAAKDLLRRCRPGSFLLRDSDNPQYLFSLSQNLHFVGPIATRIFFQDGLFWFDDGRQRMSKGSRGGGSGSTSSHSSHISNVSSQHVPYPHKNNDQGHSGSF